MGLPGTPCGRDKPLNLSFGAERTVEPLIHRRSSSLSGDRAHKEPNLEKCDRKLGQFRQLWGHFKAGLEYNWASFQGS